MAAPLTLRAGAALLAWLAAGAASAGVWLADQHAGELRFIAIQAGARFAGHFREFGVRLDFDPTQPANGRLDVTVAMPSADTADIERDEVLHGPDFFWVGRYPKAEYHAQRFEPDGRGWRASGELTLRGVTRPVAVRFELQPRSGRYEMKGGATLHRLAFGVGQGEWASTEWIGDPVEVAFKLDLRPEPAAAVP